MKQNISGLLRQVGKKIIPYKLQPVSFYKKMRGEGVIMTGPFKGMNYLTLSVGSCLYPKIYGVYEKELHSIINSIAGKEFQKILIVGAGEGYYVAGLGKLFPDKDIIAFEMDSGGRSAIQQLTSMNALTNVKVHGECTAESLKSIISSEDKNFIIMDVEGGEENLLTEEVAESARKSDILVEIHDFVDRSIGDKLKQRFNKTHKLVEIFQENRTLVDLPVRLSFFERRLYKGVILKWLSESRPERMRWFYFVPKLHENFTH